MIGTHSAASSTTALLKPYGACVLTPCFYFLFNPSTYPGSFISAQLYSLYTRASPTAVISSMAPSTSCPAPSPERAPLAPRERRPSGGKSQLSAIYTHMLTSQWQVILPCIAGERFRSLSGVHDNDWPQFSHIRRRNFDSLFRFPLPVFYLQALHFSPAFPLRPALTPGSREARRFSFQERQLGWISTPSFPTAWRELAGFLLRP